ncbi:MAG: hypothetical protein PHQ23_05015 [Candidatus Wallbacteria bacterium]|nr:hypothetical protein [Candidatus Wallbacteria bacterium]
MREGKNWLFMLILALVLASVPSAGAEEEPEQGMSTFLLEEIRSEVVEKLQKAEVGKIDSKRIEGHIKARFESLKDKSNPGMIAELLANDIIAEYRKSHRSFNPDKANILVGFSVIAFFVLLYIFKAMKGEHLYIRPISGLQAIDEAVGRATEMGKDVLYVPGIYDVSDLPTLASVSILGHVAKKTAEYETDITMPVAAPILFTTAKEVIKEAHLKAGRPDTYKDDCVRYLTGDQFAYAGGVCGIMVREKPATIFYMGTFYAESLILAETGHYIDAIQIAGTTQTAQLPFFVAACDYTIIGEEMYAASAYFSQEPMQLGSLKGQDICKLIAMVSIVIGTLLTSLASFTGNPWFDFFKNLFAVNE